ncbi:hypothetical protein O181_119970 [Austropuccinia psidii MF-1]|uniref:Uncharacterized protein n=1 Tax=Austropuccinia psidii MF-1 TaxID=1389203 RepID=A0A9Q3KJA9_9BASI|nr:hypothetical protein [Austropuccinia psidii MF-1]
MPVQHSPPTKNTRSQRHEAVLTFTARAPLDHTPPVHKLSENLDRGPPMEGEAPSRRGVMKSRRSRSFYGLLAEDEEEESEETEVAAALSGPPEGSEAPNLAPSDQPLVSQVEPVFLKMMEQMIHLMGQLPKEVSKGHFRSPSIQDSINEGT